MCDTGVVAQHLHTGILWNVFRAQTGFPRSPSEICEQIYCLVLLHPACYLSKCCVFTKEMQSSPFFSLIYCGMFDDHWGGREWGGATPKKKASLKQPGRVKLNCLITSSPLPPRQITVGCFYFLALRNRQHLLLLRRHYVQPNEAATL